MNTTDSLHDREEESDPSIPVQIAVKRLVQKLALVPHDWTPPSLEHPKGNGDNVATLRIRLWDNKNHVKVTDDGSGLFSSPILIPLDPELLFKDVMSGRVKKNQFELLLQAYEIASPWTKTDFWD